MKVLLLDRHALFRHSMHEVLAQLGGVGSILEAASMADFVRQATAHDDIALVIAYPPSLDLDLADCISLTRRLVAGARLAFFRDTPDPAVEGRYPEIVFLDRAADGDTIADALRGAEPLRGSAVAFGDGASATPAAGPIGLVRASQTGAAASGTQTGRCADLSFRQRQIMAMVAEGLANKEIAARLGIAEGTVKAHIHAVFKALGVTNRTQAVVRYGGALRQAG
ncbi:LuxR family two component transcriptional regulator [Rhodothalassium salexigens DSM 2132]|uniref:LuxR family two component transcriptional regulator n=1 Tax=Rhodothalassium salexigens DSM 2132 TaxID=1188247 RepID=A0A4R2PMK4_RHOSA|nr:response regulator transcription factor [Rhodothalassium salexigens]MBB4211354.1 DNA-binding NarL/FixJ family response regulator [Rhodothalassium salexigens DSM 2132]TCP35275.1 LuxR family two component transcriptional regulator [Rhodothalassium salexigens DSM 2132]